ncbi:hypothetical protein CsatB_024454 [Cannabis sativa]
MSYRSKDFSESAMESTNFCPLNPHFHRMILQDSLFDNKLKIPREFMLKYASNMNTSNSVVLKVPSGGAWKVKLTKCDDGHDVWLGEGWPDFARHHSIQCGFSLLFRYEGQSRFHVVIIDANGSEICYKLKPNIIDEPRKRIENNEYLKSHSQFSTPNRRKTKFCVSSSNSSSRSSDNDEECFKSLKITDTRLFKACTKRKRSMTMTVEEKAKALSKTENFKSPYPYFKIVLQKTHVDDHFNMAILTEFWKRHVDDNSCHDVTLYVPCMRKTWLVKLQTKTRNRCSSPRPTFSRRDWQEFVEENELKVGDVCIFELTNKNQMMFHVSIHRETECNDRNNQQCEGNMKYGAKSKDHSTGQVANGAASSSRDSKSFGGSTKQSNPSFEMVLGQSSDKVKRVPNDFANSYLQGKAGVVTLQVGKKLWSVNLCSTSGGLILSGGWPRFAKENHLKPGDSCVFELVTKEMDKDNILLNVTISRLIRPAVM